MNELAFDNPLLWVLVEGQFKVVINDVGGDDLARAAKRSCRRCYGRGFLTYDDRAEACSCVLKNLERERKV